MEKNTVKRNLLSMLFLVVAVLCFGLIGHAGNLEPSASPGSTMKTLDEIFGTVDSLASGRLTYPEKLRIDQYFPSGAGPYLRLQIDGNDISGESTVLSLDREDTIECFGFDHKVSIPYDAQTHQLGSRIHGPVSILKRTDKSSPLLYKALCQREPVTSADFMFFRPSLGVGGAEERYLTVRLETASIVSIETVYPNVERVTFLYNDITWTYEIGGVTFRDDLSHP